MKRGKTMSDRQIAVPWSSWDWKMRGSQIFSLVCECMSGREGIYHKHSTASLIPLCIHGWLGRNTRGHFSHPVGSSNIHASHIVAVQVRRLMLLSQYHHRHCSNNHYNQGGRNRRHQQHYFNCEVWELSCKIVSKASQGIFSSFSMPILFEVFGKDFTSVALHFWK